ncbi:MAG: hypothetical protein J7647_21885 [Cyanobacteria bacterium SBLK]|nr:hypothetical protein [Cyanobacteria bacterium SBLK]
MTTLTQTKPTAQRLDLSPSDRELVAKVATRDLCHTQEFNAADIRAVTLRDGMVDIYFTKGGKTIITVAQFKEWIAEYKAEGQISEEQAELATEAAKHPHPCAIDLKQLTASFHTKTRRHLGTVYEQSGNWYSTTSTRAFYNPQEAIESVVCCTDEEWKEAKRGLEDYDYIGDGFWDMGRESTCIGVLLQEIGLDKTPRELAIIEQEIFIA